MPQLFYVVATPIGNRDDISIRALKILGSVDFIVAEDTRHSGELLSMYGVKKPMLSFRDAPTPVMDRCLSEVMQRVNEGQTGAYITDAGTPGISDPGWRLVKALQEAGTIITPIPGASAVTALLSVADIPLDEYRFIGFLPKKKGNQTKLQELVDYLNHKDARGVVIYESPNRVRKTLTDFMIVNPNLYVVIGRELTKKFESLYRGKLTKELVQSLPEKGEYAICVATSID